jgi:predicted glycoside hydrolase/deacetylase ChbG (UPF0249 family)
VTKYLIVNADDLGISRSTNHAVERAFRDGVVTSASLMANMPSCQHAIDRVIGGNPGLGVGVHLCLTSGRPLCDPARLPLLVDARGRFRHGFLGLVGLLRSGRHEAAAAQIREELEAQARRLDACGVRIDHVDGHQHVHVIPGIFAAAAEIAAARGAAIRIPAAGSRAPRSASGWFSAGAAKILILRWLVRRAVGENERKTAATCLGVAESGHLTSAVLGDLLPRLPEGASELLCHPGWGNPDEAELVCSREDRRFLASAARVGELAALVDPALRRQLPRWGIVLARFADVGAPLLRKSSA